MPTNTQQTPYPDVETSSDGYALRFTGTAGEYLLEVQKQAILSSLPPNRSLTMLDVGGGHGQTAPFLVRAGHQVTVQGSALCTRHRLLASELWPELGFVVSEPQELPFAANTFDVVLAVRLVSHMPNWASLLEEFCRVARYHVIIDYPRSSGLNAFTPVLFGLKKRLEGNTRTYANFRDATLASIFDQHGFKVALINPQFILPMVLHRVTGAATPLRVIEHLAARWRFLNRWRSPVILRADALGSSL